MSSSLLLILIGVVWLFVLAPLAVKSMKPIRRTSDALTETRVLHKGGSDLTSRKRRPQVTRADIREFDDSDVETVEAVELSDEEAQLIVEETPEAIIEGDEVLELEEAAPEADAESGADDEVAESEQTAVLADAADEEWMSSYVLPEDLMVLDDEAEHPTTLNRSFAGDADPEFAEAAEDANTAADAELTEDVTDDQARALAALTDEELAELDSDELTEADLEFLARRKGRGYLDPEAERHYAELRFQRRRRWVLILAALTVIAVIAAVAMKTIVAWLAPVAAVGMLVAYLWYLRKTVLAEKALRTRRIHHLRRARMGVRTAAAEEMGIPERLRRPGAVVLEVDDEDPVFEHLEYAEWHPEVDEFEDRRFAG